MVVVETRTPNPGPAFFFRAGEGDTGARMPSNHRNNREFSERATVERLLAPILRAYEAELVDMELVGQPGGKILRIFLEKLGSSENGVSSQDGSVDVDTCARIARELSPGLDVADVIKGRYDLEVGTPGVERALRTERDYVRFVGKKAKFTLESPIDKQNALTGNLAGVERAGAAPQASEATPVDTTAPEGEPAATAAPSTDDFVVLLEIGSKTVRIPGNNISRAQLVFEFGPAPKKGGNPKNKHA